MDKSISQRFREASRKQLQTLKPEDIIIFDDKPIPENYTVIIRPKDETLEIIQNIIKQLKLIEPKQFYYPTESIHMTLIGNIDISIHPDIIVNSVQQIMNKYTMKFILQGLGSNNLCVSINTYPFEFSIHEIRNVLRKMLNHQGEDYQKFIEYYEYIGWINICRYLQIPQQSFLHLLYSYRDKIFGELVPVSIEIYKTTSKILAADRSTLIKKFNL